MRFWYTTAAAAAAATKPGVNRNRDRDYRSADGSTLRKAQSEER